MRTLNEFFVLCLIFSLNANELLGQIAQVDRQSHYEHEYVIESHEEGHQCVSVNHEQKLDKILDEYEAYLLNKNEVHETSEAPVSFIWPLKQADGFQQNDYYSINNYVDLAIPGFIMDYNCEARAYDGHRGIDMDLWPFAWKMMSENQVEVIAAAGGTIIEKFDGNDDQSCPDNLGTDWNAVYVMHTDGTISYYGHLKTGSLTTKPKFSTVSQGEYLGTVGSSGSSTYPHLHFEVSTSNYVTLEPYSGDCDVPGLWQNQKPYWEPALNLIQTHNVLPYSIPNQCASDEEANFENNFEPGNFIYYSAYFRDIQVGDLVTYKVFNPNAVEIDSWTSSAGSTSEKSWIIRTQFLPSNSVAGPYSYEVTYRGNTYTHYFYVGCPDNITIADQDVLSDVEYHADKSITTQGTVDIMPFNIPSSFMAGKHVELHPGTTIHEGASFEVKLEGCP